MSVPYIKIKKDQSEANTTPETAGKSDYIGKKNILVTSQRRNTRRLWLAVTFDKTGTPPATNAFKALRAGATRFYSAPKGWKIEFLWTYVDGGTQYLDWEASDGSIENLTPINFEELTREEWLSDGNYVDRWEQFFRSRLYHGRTGAFYKSESTANTPFNDLTTPPILAAADTKAIAPWNNAIDMTNSIDGVTKDDCYVAFPKAHFRAKFRFDALLPTLAHLGVADGVWVGFEVNSAGGHAIASLHGTNGHYYLEVIRTMDTAEINTTLDVSALLTHLGSWATYILMWNHPYLTLLEATAGAYPFYTQIGQVMVLGRDTPDEKMVPFVTNESATTIVSDFQIGIIQIWEVKKEPILKSYTVVDPAANPYLIANVAGRQHVEIYARGVTAAVAVYVENGDNGVDFYDCDALTLAVTAPSGLKTVAKGYLNASRFVKVTINEHLAGTYNIIIRASVE